MTKLRCMLCCLMICTITIDARTVNDIYKRISAQVSLKVPGNQSRNYSLAFQGAVDDKGIYLLESEEKIPLIITAVSYTHLDVYKRQIQRIMIVQAGPAFLQFP